MKIEIVSPDDMRARGRFGQKSLLINNEFVMSGTKKEIMNKIDKIIEAWI